VNNNSTMTRSYAPGQTKKSFSRASSLLEPASNLVQIQLDSFRWFQEQGLAELLSEFGCIRDFTGNQFELRFLDYEFRPPRHTERECREHDMTYASPLYVRSQLVIKKTGEIKEQQIFMGDFPLMTPKGTFIVGGTERVVVSQLIRSPGVYFTLESDINSGRELCCTKLVPAHGAWLDFETSVRDMISVKVEGKRRMPVTALLRAVGYESDEEILELFREVDVSPDHCYIQSTIDRESILGASAELGSKPGTYAAGVLASVSGASGTANSMSASTLIHSLLFDLRRYNLGKVGRYKLNKRMGRELLLVGGVLTKKELAKATPEEIERLVTERFKQPGLTKEDLVAIMWHMIMVNNRMDRPDDIDHLGNRRVRTVGELIQNQLRIGLLRSERIIKERMTLVQLEVATPSTLVNIRPIIAAMREFFGGSQLSQFMDQTNPLAELTHKRRLSALGPGGLSRERAGFEVRDVHYSHYGRICPIETPEGPNVGLIGALSTYSQINEHGFIESPYRRVLQEVPSDSELLLNRILAETVKGKSGSVIAKEGKRVSEKIVSQISALSPRSMKVAPFVSNEVMYLSADEEENYIIAQANTPLDEDNHFVGDKAEVRLGKKLFKEVTRKVDLMDVSPKQIISITTSLIPFLEHDDANRALMGSNMQRQAVPLVCPEPALVATGMEELIARHSGQVVTAPDDGEIAFASSDQIVFRSSGGEEQSFPLEKFVRTNQGTCLNQRPTVCKGDRVRRGQTLADSTATSEGELALGQNVLCAFMSWRGYNFEDAIIISEELLAEDKFTSIHIERYEVEAQDTKLGDEEITRDVPGVGEESLRNLDEDGIICVGAEVEAGDILVGKVTPRGETELTAEEKLLRALFGEKARKVKDTSLRMPHGERGRVIGMRVFSRERRDELPAGVNTLVRVWVAQKRKLAEGDKLTGRHGNKGVIARILPREDMPYLPDGTPVQLVLNPVGVPSRMNLGQILETHLGWAADALGFRAITPVFEGATDLDIEDSLALSWIAQRSGAIESGPGGDGGQARVRWDIAESWLAERGYEGWWLRGDGDTHKGEAKHMCLRLWLEEQGVSAEGYADSEVVELAENESRQRELPLPISGKTILYDGLTGEPFDQPVTVGYIYMMKLIHLVEDKIHARSTGPYSLVTQQPLGGKAQFGGQRFGEMEAWALEAYGAAYTLQELLTIKSDDVVGRAKAYEAIIKGDKILPPRVPGSFKVLIKELQSLGLSVRVTSEKTVPERKEVDNLQAALEELKKGDEYAQG
jgi:DNA-directed RNA polymerase subunit beta